MRLVIFGAGAYYNSYKDYIRQEDEIVGLLDNNKSLQGQYLDGIPIYPSEAIGSLKYDAIILMASLVVGMKKQLLQLGVPDEKIYYCGQYCHEMNYGKFVYYGNLHQVERGDVDGKKILIVSTFLDYLGGAITAIYAAAALQKRGYDVTIVAPGGNSKILKEIVGQNIKMIVYPALPHIEENDLLWIQSFDAVIVNTLPMIQCVCEIRKVKPTIWWIHESSDRYENIYNSVRYQFAKYALNPDFGRIHIYGISQIAKRNFREYYPDIGMDILVYGIPDEHYDWIMQKNKIVFAIIGNVSVRKAQKVFVEAVKRLEEAQKEQAEFWIIGSIGSDSYGRMISEFAGQERAIKIFGQMTREEIHKAYEKIDVIVCPSLEETMSIVLTEGIMYEKICISSDATGMAEYIEDGRNGFVCTAEDVGELTERIRWVIQNRNSEALTKIRYEARQTYEKYFTMDIFADRLEYVVQQAIRDWYDDKVKQETME